MLLVPVRLALASASLTTFALSNKDFTDSGLVKGADVQASLRAELAAIGSQDSRLLGLQDELRWMYASLPKNAKGKLDHTATRYALHRFFLHRNGWHLKGLEPGRVAPDSAESGEEEWVPDYLQQMLERRVGSAGAGLQELAALAAALMDLVQKEADGRLDTAMRVHDVPSEAPMDHEKTRQVLTTFYASYLQEGAFPATSATAAEEAKKHMSKEYPGWSESQLWISDLIDQDFAKNPSGAVSFKTAAGMANEIGERYHEFNDGECRDLKSALRETESKKPGRIRLSAFYRLKHYKHWNFEEKVEYLRDLGALDESDPRQAYVIIPNYIMALNNCLGASHLYSMCCRNTCEDLMQHVEKSVGADSAPPETIAQLVAALPSDSVQAPRNLSGSLLVRLTEVAAHHGGQVPLHGRLFAQWMHHAYPMECPFPHEAGSTNPQFADNWMKTTGESTKASALVVKRVVEEDTCSIDAAGRPLCDGETEELQWIATEERFASVASAFRARDAEDAEPQACLRFVLEMLLLLMAVAVAGIWNAFAHRRALAAGRKCEDVLPCFSTDADDRAKLQAPIDPAHAAVAAAVTLLVYLVDLLDGRLFALAVVCGGVALVMQHMMAGKTLSATEAEAKLAAGCCV